MRQGFYKRSEEMRQRAIFSLMWPQNAAALLLGQDGKEKDTLIVKAGKEEGVLLAMFDVDAMREFRAQESWRINYRKEWYKKNLVCSPDILSYHRKDRIQYT